SRRALRSWARYREAGATGALLAALIGACPARASRETVRPTKVGWRGDSRPGYPATHDRDAYDHRGGRRRHRGAHRAPAAIAVCGIRHVDLRIRRRLSER